MLRKWKAQKLEQKKAERAKAKPLFKVCHVEHKPFVNIGAAYNSIKGVAVPNRVNSKVSAGTKNGLGMQCSCVNALNRRKLS